MPGPRLNPNAADAETFGGGQSLENLSSAARETTLSAVKLDYQKRAVAAVQKKAANELMAQDIDFQLGVMENNLRAKAKSMQGKDAFGAKDIVDKEWSDGYQAIIKDLTPEQRLLVQKKAQARYLSLDESVQNHTGTQILKHQQQSTADYMSNELNTAAQNYNDLELVQRSILTQKAAFLKLADAQGLDKKQREKGIRDILTKTHVAVIDGYINAGDSQGAKDYFNFNRNQIDQDEAKKYPDYIESKAREHANLIKFQQEQIYDETNGQALTDFYNGKFSLSEAFRLRSNRQMKDSDFEQFVARFKKDDFSYIRGDLQISDSSEFNRIRQAQLSGQLSKGQIDRMIIASENSKGLLKPNAKYLHELNNGAATTPKSQHIESQAQSVRDFATRYLTQSWMESLIDPGKAARTTEDLVSQFYKRIDAENPDGERIDEIAKEVINGKIKKDHPEINRLEDVPHVVVGVGGKITRLFQPTQTTKLKADFTVTRNKKPEPKPAAKK